MEAQNGREAPNLLETHLDELEKAVGWVVRKHRLSLEDAEELRSLVYLKLVENDHQVLRRFEGKSSLKTYLSTVVHRVALDYRDRRWGRWRPSRTAQRLGCAALLLETLILRDGWSVGEAVEILKLNHRLRLSRLQLRRLWERLPGRRRRRIRWTPLSSDPKAGERTDGPVLEAEAQGKLEGLWRTLEGLLCELSAEERLILRLRFHEGMKIREIANALSMPTGRLYRQLRRCLLVLRVGLEREGFGGRLLWQSGRRALTAKLGGRMGDVLGSETR